MLSGETISKKAKWIIYPIFFIFLFDFILFLIRWQLTGDSGTTTGKIVDDDYRIIEHGRTINVSGTEYFFCRIQLISLVVCFFAVIISRVYFFRTGDLKKNI